MELFEELKWRGLISDVSNQEKIESFFKNKLAAYVGCDPSAKSFHLGNYLTLTLIKRLRDNGHMVVALVGGITGLIGDPRDPKLSSSTVLERQLKTKNEIEANVIELKKQFVKYAHASEVVNNADFYKDMSVADYLRDIGKLINVNYLLEKDLIARRLETGISYAEFSYTLLQGYDSLYLYNNKNVVCQFGGADQWGNITTGLEMIRKVVGSDNKACCFSVPLLLKPDGTKFGKSESGSIYLDPEMTAPFEMYQFFFNQPDSQVEELLKKFTFLKKDEIIEICEKHVKEPSARIAQKALAQQVITDIHGENEYQKCLKISNALYTNSLHDLTTNELYSALSGTRKFNAEKNSYSVIELLVESGICKSKSDARTLIEQKAIFVNNDLVTDINAIVSQANSIEGKFSYIRKGKKDYTLIDFKN